MTVSSFNNYCFTVTWLCNLRCRFYLRVHSFGMIQIRISDLWHLFDANPFLDHWSIESTLEFIRSVIWMISNWSLDHWSATFHWHVTQHCGFLLRASQVHYIWKQICHCSHALGVLNFIEVSSCNLALFLPVLAKIGKKTLFGNQSWV